MLNGYWVKDPLTTLNNTIRENFENNDLVDDQKVSRFEEFDRKSQKTMVLNKYKNSKINDKKVNIPKILSTKGRQRIIHRRFKIYSVSGDRIRMFKQSLQRIYLEYNNKIS